jgi:antitoxin (DNA-binding transcriptional repressor) of toxin-antitoxin stability system
MERAAAGETVDVKRRGKPYVRLTGAANQPARHGDRPPY